MSFSNFLRNIFGIPDNRFPDNNAGRQNGSMPNADEFRKPIWNLDDEDDDDDDFRSPPPTRAFGFQIFTNPLEMHRFFEHQMGEIITSFQNEIIRSFQNEMPPSFGNGFPALEPPEGMREHGTTPECPADKYLKPGYRHRTQLKRSDENLDERIRTGGLDSILRDSVSEEPGSSALTPRRGLLNRCFGSSVMTQTIRRPDGVVEHHRIVRDSQGNEETTVTRQVGDRSYTVTTQLDQSGVQKRTENFVNIDEGSLSDFEKNWKEKVGAGNIQPGEEYHQKPHNWFPFNKFF